MSSSFYFIPPPNCLEALPLGSYDPEIAIVLDGPGAPPKKSDGSDMYTVHVLNDLILMLSLTNPRENLLLKAHPLHVSEMHILMKHTYHDTVSAESFRQTRSKG